MYTKREREKKKDIEGEIDDHENGGIRENSRHA
jgi:hypothetical protein